jgi:5-methylcytosine-specific restriction endonuclease McrA
MDLASSALELDMCVCGKTGVALQPDHRVPLARGGSNAIDNILPACRSCNQRKALMSEDEFRARLVAERDRQQP